MTSNATAARPYSPREVRIFIRAFPGPELGCYFIIASRTNQLAFRKRRFGRGWRGTLTCSCLISLPVSARDSADRPTDVVVDVILQVCEGYAHRPIGSGKAAAVEQDDAVVLGQPEHDVERVHVRLHPLDDVLAQVFAGKKLEIDQAVIVVEVLIRTDFDVQSFDRCVDPLLADADAGFLISLLFVNQLTEREQRHHDLLRKRKPGRVIERDVAAVGNDAVDEGELARLQREPAVALVQQFLNRFGMRCNHLVKNVVLVDRDRSQPPPGAAEILAVRVDADRVLWELSHQRTETRDERAIDVIGQQDQVWPFLENGPDFLNRLWRKRDSEWIARIDDEERLNLRVEKFFELFIRILKPILLLRVNLDVVQVIVLQMRHFEVRREDRYPERDRVAGVENSSTF